MGENEVGDSRVTPTPTSKAGGYILEPPEGLDAAIIYLLYRGAIGEVNGQAQRIWVDFSALQLSWATYDKPAPKHCRLSLLDLTACTWAASPRATNGSDMLCVEIWGPPSTLSLRKWDGTASALPLLSVDSAAKAMLSFAEALKNLLAIRDSEGKRKLEFIQRSLFQYLWRHQEVRLAENSEQALFEAQAVLAFNLEPKEGVKYLKTKLGKTSSSEIGKWLAHMSTVNGGLDPTLLGNYFSRRDTLEVFKEFVQCLDFSGLSLDVALRRLFDTFKPGGESQVINRILELFAEAYFLQWSQTKASTLPQTAYAAPDTVLATAFSLIMLNTGLHVAARKGKASPMTCEEFITNTRRVVEASEVPDGALQEFYTSVKENEISMQPMPRVAFSRLPVQPDIEGWLTVLVGPSDLRRFWAVLALQRLYLFSDNSDVDPADACDLKDAQAVKVADDSGARERFSALLRGRQGKCFCLFPSPRADSEMAEMENRAFEVNQQGGLWPTLGLPLNLVLAAESADLTEKWVNFIACHI